MNFSKPTYDPKNKIYTVSIINGVRFTMERESPTTPFTPTIENIKKQILPDLVKTIISGTQGWFSKPLTADWLTPRITMNLDSIPAEFEGSAEWSANTLYISKETFTLQFIVTDMKKSEKVIIDLQEDDVEQVESLESLQSIKPIEDFEEIQMRSDEVVGIGPTRRILHKKSVMQARAKAARALFKAERMMQEYSNLYGNETDWESESEADSD